jgi:Uma2 family endonuclease
MTSLKLSAGTRLSVDEFLDLDETDDKPILELDDGELIVMPRPRRPHQYLQLEIMLHFVSYLDGFDEPPADVWHEGVTILSREWGRVLIPDVVVILRDRSQVIVRGYVEGAPDIVVEIISPNSRNRDLVRKRQLYAEASVPEYWIFDQRNDSVTLLELGDGEYVERALLDAAGTVTTPLLPGLSIPLAEIFHHRRRPPRDDE